jgi:MFS family permease
MTTMSRSFRQGSLRQDESAGGLSRLLPPLVLGAMLNPLNSTMLSTALTRLTHSFGRDVSAGALLITPLYITAMIGQPLMGRLADRYSPKAVNYLGLALVLLAVVIGMAAPSFNWLILSRVVLGLGTSANYPSAIAILRRYYAEKGLSMPRNALGWMAIGGQVSLVLGPVLGGVLTQWWGWQGIFLVNVPLVLVVVWLSRGLPSVDQVERVPDAGGNGGAERPGMWRLFAQRPVLLLIYIQSSAAGLIMYLTLYGLPQWLQGVRKLSPSGSGLLLVPLSFAAAASALWISRRGSPALIRWLAVSSALAASMGLFLLQAGSPMAVVVGVSILLGIATGINPIANQASLNEEAPQELSGIAFGLYRTFTYLGAIASGALLKIIFHKGVTDGSFRQIAWCSLCSALIMIVLYLPLLVGRGRREKLGEERVQMES